VFSLITGDFLVPWKHASGHLYFKLRNDNGEQVHIHVHHLVLLTFIGPPSFGEEACHRDGSAENNSLSNLRWAPRSENIEDYRRLNGRHWRARLSVEQAMKIRAAYTGRRGEQVLLAEKYGVSKYVISDIVRGKTYKEIRA